jgi:hypothetical protein
MKYNCGNVSCDFHTDTSWKCKGKHGKTQSGEGYSDMLAAAESMGG